MINALEVPLKVDLSAFSAHLSTHGVRHRISEEGLNQVVWVASEQQAAIVTEAYMRLESGDLDLPQAAAWPARVTPRFALAYRQFPLTLVLIAITILCFPIGMRIEGFSDLFFVMIFTPAEQVGNQIYIATLQETFERGEFWRLLTPMFIHFGWLHIVFNMLWVWEIGRRIEVNQGASVFLAVVVVSSLLSNLGQYWLTGPGFFGGMSGVVYGLLGHALIWSKLLPSRNLGVPNGVYIFMLVYLALGFTGAIDLLGIGTLANGAHLGGLIGGLFTGGLAVLLARLPASPKH